MWSKMGNEIEFIVSGKSEQESDWIGVGFSKNNVMVSYFKKLINFAACNLYFVH